MTVILMNKIQDRWVIDRKGRRRLGSFEPSLRRLDYAANIVATTDKDYELVFWAKQAWHWGLALQGR